jgi:hypothetical protein
MTPPEYIHLAKKGKYTPLRAGMRGQASGTGCDTSREPVLFGRNFGTAKGQVSGSGFAARDTALELNWR